MGLMRNWKQILTIVFLTSLWLVRLANAQGGNGISSPRDNAVVSGVVLIEGTATDPSFLRYEMSFFKEFDPLGDWVVFATGDRPVVGGVLAAWDTTVGRNAGAPFYPDGTYRLRLRVVRQDSNYDEYYILGLSLANETATETPSPTPELENGATAVPTSVIAIPTELPTLTPFPTNTPRPTAVDQETSGGDSEPPAEEPGGSFLSIEGEFNTSQVRAGLLFGVQLALIFFLMLALYVIGRRVLRWLLGRLSTAELPEQIREWLSK